MPRQSILRQQVVAIVRERGLKTFEEPVKLASGGWSRDFIDGKAAFANGEDLKTACRAVLEAVGEIEFDVVGGLTMGADHFAHGISILEGCEWFSVRKESKDRGTNRLVEGADVDGKRVLLVDDVVTMGGSIRRAFDAITELGGSVVAAVTLVDRADRAGRFFEENDIPYIPVVTYRELGIEPVQPDALVA